MKRRATDVEATVVSSAYVLQAEGVAVARRRLDEAERGDGDRRVAGQRGQVGHVELRNGAGDRRCVGREVRRLRRVDDVLISQPLYGATYDDTVVGTITTVAGRTYTEPVFAGGPGSLAFAPNGAGLKQLWKEGVSALGFTAGLMIGGVGVAALPEALPLVGGMARMGTKVAPVAPIAPLVPKAAEVLEERGPQAAEALVRVSRWGRPGLVPGDWVMKGPVSWWNYFWSGKWQPGMGNLFAPFSSGEEFKVPPSSLQSPTEFFLTNWLKALLGQRIYRP